MSKVEISNERGRWRVAVDDGPDLAPAITAGGLSVESRDDCALVHITLLARELTMHLDGAVIEAAEALLPEGFRPRD